MMLQLPDRNDFESIQIDQMHRLDQYALAHVDIAYVNAFYAQKAVKKDDNFEAMLIPGSLPKHG